MQALIQVSKRRTVKISKKNGTITVLDVDAQESNFKNVVIVMSTLVSQLFMLSTPCRLAG
jgi:hypothetical protein